MTEKNQEQQQAQETTEHLLSEEEFAQNEPISEKEIIESLGAEFEESTADLGAMVSELQEELVRKHEELLRAHAEVENIRRRSQEEVAKARKFSLESFAESLIPVRDSLEAALAHEQQSVDAYREGVETTLRQLIQAFERNSLKEVAPAIGDAFDPNVHQAISSISDPNHATNTIVQVLQKGYTLSERVVRPALVVVAV
ncbi:MAG: nucleotide exchange factor GrpE [Alcaligenaceae bacterium]|nr:nucleotide exchange factor GrpE [Alcaligenaceae bacterium]